MNCFLKASYRVVLASLVFFTATKRNVCNLLKILTERIVFDKRELS